MKSWTIDQMMAEKPCATYPREHIEKLWAGREALTLRDGCDLDIPNADVIWWATRPGAMPEDQQAAWIERIVTRAVTLHAAHCGIPSVEEWAARWLDGSDRSAATAWTAVVTAARATEWATAETREAAAAAAAAAAWAAKVKVATVESAAATAESAAVAAEGKEKKAAKTAAREAEQDQQRADLIMELERGK